MPLVRRVLHRSSCPSLSDYAGGHLLGAVPDALLHHPTHPVAVLPHAFEVLRRVS